MTLMSKLTTADDLPGLLFSLFPSFTFALFTPSPQAAAASAAAVAIDARRKNYLHYTVQQKNYMGQVMTDKMP